MPKDIIESYGKVPVPPLEGESPQGLSKGVSRGRLWAEGILSVTLLGFFVFNYLYSEKVPFANGLGWDGQLYGAWAADLPGALKGGLDHYYVGRFLPSALVYYGLRVASLPRTVHNILLGFEMMNLASVALCLWFWKQVARSLELGITGYCVGAAGLFMNFYVLKTFAFYPAQTDALAFAVALAQFDAFLRHHRRTLALASVVGGFVWPTALPFGLLLLLFPSAQAEGASLRHGRSIPATIVAVLVAISYVGLCAYVIKRGYVPDFGAEKPIRAMLPLNLIVVGAYVFFGLRPLIRCQGLADPRHWWKSLVSINGALVLILYAAMAAAYSLIENGDNRFGVIHRIVFTCTTSIAKPGVSLISIATWFGPIIWLVVFYWGSVCRLVHRQGIGLTLVVLLGFLLTICSEPRGGLSAIPIVIGMAVKAAEPDLKRFWAPAVLVALNLASSRAVAKLGTIPYTGDPLAFPDQRLFRSIGPWMSHTTYPYTLAASLFSGLAIFLVCCAPRFLSWIEFSRPRHVSAIARSDPDELPAQRPAA
jgi:hypothetical protein